MTCSYALRAAGKPYPRTCTECGLGPCKYPRHQPPQAAAQTAALMQETMRGLERVFPGCAVVLLVAPFGAPPDARVNYVSNGKREDIVVFLREVLARFEGRAHDAPGGPPS